ncbi:hypothetical protein M413DRAFT_30057 [Hebeloma cylindrosporum]|uniref:Uncharacterized protein n=1 Tax=Hebeloma cylindrosporum TaxID=76867 RepID=A0A0C2YBY4_HEBCY|nr:hypothetical protein M413DRAFT_30057 [Hebeloma cylindrosporum h7]
MKPPTIDRENENTQSTPVSIPHQSLTPPIETALQEPVIHFKNCGNVQNTYISTFGDHRPRKEQSKKWPAAPKVQETSRSSKFDGEFSSSFEDAYPDFDEDFSRFDEAFSTFGQRSQAAKPHTPSMSTGPPVPQPTHYPSAPHNTRDTKREAPSANATTRREDVPATPRSPCPGFSEDETRDDAGITITIAKLCSHADCSFMSDDSTARLQGFRISSAESWSIPDCKPSCPGSLRYEETDSLGNVKITSKLCVHEADLKETKANDTVSETVVESDSHLDDAAYERVERASMKPPVQDASDDEDWNVI